MSLQDTDEKKRKQNLQNALDEEKYKTQEENREKNKIQSTIEDIV